jgi:threonine/homoserine/homoserine lactone efflux protein
MNLFFCFVIAFIISALSSFPTGLVTLNVMQRTKDAGKKAGYMFSLGALVMEFVYTYIALFGLQFFQENVATNFYMQVFATLVFFGFGFYNLFKKQKELELDQGKVDYFDFGRGVLVTSMNVLIIPFWLFIAHWLSTYDLFFDTPILLMVFSIGSALGAFVVFILYVELTHFILGRIGKVVQYTDKLVGIIFFILGIYQVIQFL